MLLRYASAFDPSIGGEVKVATIMANNKVTISSSDEYSFPKPTLSAEANFSPQPSGIGMANTGTAPTGSVP